MIHTKSFRSLFIAIILVVGHGAWVSAADDEKRAPNGGGIVYMPLVRKSGITAGSKPIGAFHIYPTEFASTASTYQMNATLHGVGNWWGTVEDLETAQASGFKYVTPLAEQIGHFDYALYQTQINGYGAIYSQLAPFIADGTLYGHSMFDEPCDGTKWNPAITRSDIQQAASYSKQQLPGVLVTFGAGDCLDPNKMGLSPQDGVDYPTIPYTQLKGPLADYIDEQLGYMIYMGWTDPKVILNLNVLTGGIVDPTKLAADAIYACQHPSVIMVLWWEWHGDTQGDLVEYVTTNPEYADAIRQGTAACNGQ